MGCSSGKMAVATMSNTNKELVKKSWDSFVEKGGDLSDMGIQMFLKLFQDNPDVKSLFSFMKVEGIKTDNPQFRNHVRKVFDVIGAAVAGLDDLDSLQPVLLDLGRKHFHYGAQRAHLKAVGDALLYSIEKQLESGFTNEIKNAWENFFAVISAGFSKGLEQEFRESERV